MTDKINLYINSKYKRIDENNSQMMVIVPSGLIKSYGKDYYTLSITSFYCYNTFYQMEDGLNNMFMIVTRGLQGEVQIYNKLYFKFVDCVGNPNVYNIRDELNSLLNGLCSVTYDKVKNIFYFIRTKAADGNKMYLKIINCGNFLGFPKSCNNQEIEITTTGISSYQPINVIYHQQLLINIDGDISMQINNLDNKNGDTFEASGVLFVKSIDTNRHNLLTYDNYDGNASFQYKISKTDQINQINLRITNQDNEIINSLGDWYLTMQFEKHDDDLTESLLTQIKEYLSYIFLIIGNYLKI